MPRIFELMLTIGMPYLAQARMIGRLDTHPSAARTAGKRRMAGIAAVDMAFSNGGRGRMRARAAGVSVFGGFAGDEPGLSRF
jgi:hypothetical protein